jgi:aldose 1-epimerase
VPTGRRLAVSGTEFDFASARAIGGLVLDDCFGELPRDGNGIARVLLSGEYDVTLWMDARYRWLQLFTGETLAPARRRRGLAVEPMTCPPNAFRSGDGFLRLEPGASVEASWGIASHA